MANRGGKEAKSGPIDSSRFAGRGGATNFLDALKQKPGRATRTAHLPLPFEALERVGKVIARSL